MSNHNRRDRFRQRRYQQSAESLEVQFFLGGFVPSKPPWKSLEISRFETEEELLRYFKGRITPEQLDRLKRRPDERQPNLVVDERLSAPSSKERLS